MDNLLTIKQASVWASKHLGRDVTPSNISYLVQYGRIPKRGDNGRVLVDKLELQAYYRKHFSTTEDRWKQKLGQDLNWHLSFSDCKESERTKHVHRLHPYKGKFIPQLVEYFLDEHTDEFKKEAYFKPGDIVLDPFCGSGTTLVQANELGINAIGIDVSAFNAYISNVKVSHFDLEDIKAEAAKISKNLSEFQRQNNNAAFEQHLLEKLKEFNNKYFPSPQFRFKVRKGEINEKQYSKQKAEEFLKTYSKLVDEYNLQLRQPKEDTFLEKWFLQPVRNELDFVFEQVKGIENIKTKKVLGLVLSRTMRSCRATTHADLATLKDPITQTYYCRKHGKICKPLFSILGWWQRYVQDTIDRLEKFSNLRTDTYQRCLVGDSRNIDIVSNLKDKAPKLAASIQEEGVAGIFSSPPYVGLIDYHEQHAYAYDLFGFERNDDLEIGPLYKGRGKEARDSYIEGISEVLLNSKPVLKEDYNIFLVANDKDGLYRSIAERAGMRIVREFKRPVLSRVEKDRSAYSETIFHMKEK
ncbi:DNA methyltransferase [Sedimentisphaera salicampi]|uniref:Adenine specific DNA methylase Mod n=1 Tax=Sedimentisphaera salicampi TaxID=1941349 RepID=A0A1W6LIR2_9BACT|nr:DNA methyltransferase [Sedimentisphaera salicampi]ARN55677.1 Adenine specific DNA methylase Mod [Sedimentisphaera salicampi]